VQTYRRPAATAIFFMLCAVMITDAVPHGVLLNEFPKTLIDPAAVMLGVDSGPWNMFAPDPRVHNFNLVVEQDVDGEIREIWESENWQEMRGRDKFRHFRKINYYRALTVPYRFPASQDFVDYVARTHPSVSHGGGPVGLSKIGLQLLVPVDGGIPTKDEMTWMLFNETIATSDASFGQTSVLTPAGDSEKPNPLDATSGGQGAALTELNQ